MHFTRYITKVETRTGHRSLSINTDKAVLLRFYNITPEKKWLLMCAVFGLEGGGNLRVFNELIAHTRSLAGPNSYCEHFQVESAVLLFYRGEEDANDIVSVVFVCDRDTTEKTAPIIAMVFYKAFRVQGDEFLEHAHDFKNPKFMPF